MPALKGARLRAFGIGLLALSLAACSGGGNGGPPLAGATYYAYVADTYDATITTFVIDPETGVPTQSRSVPLAWNLQPHSLAVSPSGRFAYVVGFYRSPVYAYSIDPDTGAWNGVPGSPFSTGVLPAWIAIEPLGRYFYTAGYEFGSVAANRIEATGGLLSLTGPPFAVLGGPFRIACEPSGRFIYVLSADSETVSAFAIHTTGALIPVGGPVGVGTDPQSLTVDPSGRRLYVANRVSKDISAFAIDAATGTLTAVAGSPFAVPQPPPFMLFPEAIAIDPSGRAAFVACMGSMTLTSFLIDGTTGALTATGTVITTWNSPVGIAFGPTGRHVYVIHDSEPGTLSYYQVDPASGSIELVNAFPLGRFPGALVISRIAR
jgi:6-phosphogluconolactonase (cycloisomerase 2 family)